jgi:hypothetical protein
MPKINVFKDKDGDFVVTDADAVAPGEEDERGAEGCGCDYIVLRDDVGDRIGFGWDANEGVVDGGVVFTEDK